MAMRKGIRIHQYLDNWLVRASSHQICLRHTQDLVKICQKLGWLVNVEKSELKPKQVFNFVGYQFDLSAGRVRLTRQDIRNTAPAYLSGLAIHVSDRVINSHNEASSPRPTAYETHTVASQKQLEGTGITRKGDPNSQVAAPPFTMVARRRQCPNRPTIAPNKACSANLYRHIKRRVGRSFKQAYGKRNLVPSRKQAAYKSSRAQGSVFSLKRVSRPLHRQDSPCSNRQYHSGIVHKQGRRYEVGSAFRPFVENFDLVYQESSDSQSPTYPRPPKCGSGQAIQAGPDHPNGVVSPSRGLSDYMQPVAPQIDLFATRFNNKLPLFVSPVPDSLATAVDALSLPWEDLDAYAFPPTAILGKVVEKLQDNPCRRIILIAPGWPNMPWFWDLVAMSSQIPLSLPILPNLLTQPFNQIPHRNLTNLNLHAWLLEPQQSKSKFL